MKTTILQQDGELVAVLEGRLDTAAAAQTECDMQPLYECDGHNIVLDCTKLDYISSTGLRLFLGLLKAAKIKGSHVFITGMNDNLKQVFGLTGFSSLFEFNQFLPSPNSLHDEKTFHLKDAGCNDAACARHGVDAQ